MRVPRLSRVILLDHGALIPASWSETEHFSVLVCSLIWAQLWFIWLNISHPDIACRFSQTLCHINWSHFLHLQCVHFKRLEEVAAFVPNPLKHVRVVVYLVQVILINDPCNFIQMPGNLIWLPVCVLVHLNIRLNLLVEVEDKIVIDHGVFQCAETFCKFLR